MYVRVYTCKCIYILCTYSKILYMQKNVTWCGDTEVTEVLRSLRFVKCLEAVFCVSTHLWSIILGAFLQSKDCVSMMYSNSSTLSVA